MSIAAAITNVVQFYIIFSLINPFCFLSFTDPKADVIIIDGHENGDDFDEDDGDSELDIDDNDSTLDEYSYHFNVPTNWNATMAFDNDGRCICECGKTYKEERYLRYHKKWECNKLPTFQCVHCEYCAKRKSSLKQHLERRHPDVTTKSIK